ncbi:MAG: coenzyme F430 synthase [Methanoregula sp.]|nr:coenzyme F430 synthase [Methanoregula sp.]
MRILVLDTIHGAREIGAACASAGHTVDVVDIYRGTTPEAMQNALTCTYDLVTAPVHMDPDHPLLAGNNIPFLTHHEAVCRLLGENVPHPMIEITGSRGKTTTAHALAHILGERGVLHTSTGTYAYPEKSILFRKSIAPASVIPVVKCARQIRGWLVIEESLGVTGAGELAIITSAEDYPFAAGKKNAMDAKLASGRTARCLLVAPGVRAEGRNVIHVEDMAGCNGQSCTITWHGARHTIQNPLFLLPPYRVPLMLAAASAVLFGINPGPLTLFEALPGRMAVSREKNVVIVDNANSGINKETTLCAARYARHLAQLQELTLVIGQVEGDGKVCEGFSPEQIASAIEEVRPSRVIRVGRVPESVKSSGAGQETADIICPTLEEGRKTALALTPKGSIVLSVKTWR